MTGLPLTSTNEFGQTTATEYNDLLLRPTRSYAVNFTAPESQTIYDDNALTVKVRKQIDENNWDEAVTFLDSLGRSVKMQAKDSQGDVFVETKYDYLGRVERVTNPYRLGDTVLWSKTRYDEAGRAVESYAPVEFSNLLSAQSLGTTAYDISTAEGYLGIAVTSTDAAGKKGRSITNALGQLMVVDEPDHAGNLSPLPTSTPNPVPTPTPIGGGGGGGTNCLIPANCPVNLTGGDYGSYSTYYKYDALGKMVEVTQGKQKRWFKYDSLGRLIRVKQPEQQTNAGLNLPDAYNTSGGWSAGFTYDALGNVLTATDANNVTITNTYDRANRVKTRTYSDGTTPAVSFFYDGKGLDTTQTFAKGKLTKVENTVSQTRYTVFDNLGRLKESEQRTPVGTETIANAIPRVSKYTYNFSGALIEEEYPSGRKVKNEFEPDGDLSRIYGTANTGATERTYANSFTYTPDGRIERLRLGNGLWEAAKFNTRLQVTELALGHGVSSGDLWKLGYEYGELNADGTVNTAKNTGNIAKQALSFNGLAQPFVQTYKYDSLYRLTEAKETNNGNQTWKQNFTYDRYGNRTGHEKFIGTTQLAQTNLTHPAIDSATNRFQAGQNYGFDKNGNLTTDPESRAFTFNGDNKQSKVVANGQLVGEYFYDGEGKRVKKKSYAGGVLDEETVFVYSNGKLIAEYSSKPPPQNPTTSYTMTDQLGSPRVLTNSRGEVVSRRDFMPFGEELEPDPTLRIASLKYGTGDGIRQKFTGYQKDEETQLDFAEARMYENRHGRFTAVDPLLASGKSANPQTFNRYVYVMNNPLFFTDPDGLQVATHVGKVYTDGQNYSRKKLEGSYQFEGAKYVDAEDGFSYSVTTNGYYSIGNTAEINARAESLSMADSRTREQAYSNSSLPSSWIPELQIDPPGYAEASNPRGGKFTVTENGETDYSKFLHKTDEPRAFALAVGVIGGLGQRFGSLGGASSTPRSSFFTSGARSESTFGEKLFLSEKFGFNSSAFGNSAFNSNNTSGSWNRNGSFFKAGWSGVGAPQTFSGANKLVTNPIFGDNGGMQFRISINSRFGNPHRYIPSTFVPNSFSNPHVFRPAPKPRVN